jgi:hypothetical protein
MEVSESLSGLGMPEVFVWFTDFPYEKLHVFVLFLRIADGTEYLQPPVLKDWNLVPMLPVSFCYTVLTFCGVHQLLAVHSRLNPPHSI